MEMEQFNSSIANKNSVSTGGNVLVAASNIVEGLKTNQAADFVLTEPIPSRESDDSQNHTRYLYTMFYCNKCTLRIPRLQIT